MSRIPGCASSRDPRRNVNREDKRETAKRKDVRVSRALSACEPMERITRSNVNESLKELRTVETRNGSVDNNAGVTELDTSNP